MDDLALKNKVVKVVEMYIQENPEEFADFSRGMDVERSLTVDEFASMQGSPHRQLHTMPETLFKLLNAEMNAQEMAWFSETKTAQWFATTFPAFTIAQKI